MKIETVLMFVAFLILFSCNNSNTPEEAEISVTADTVNSEITEKTIEVIPEKLPKMPEWLIGRWLYKSENSSTTEVWAIENDSTYSGSAYITVKAGTIISENHVKNYFKCGLP